MDRESAFEIWPDRRVLVTGHTGFKGGWLSLWLQAAGADVHGFALDPPTETSLFSETRLASHVDSTIGDVNDLQALVDCLERTRPEVVFHLAAQPLVRLSYDRPVETFATNVMGTAHVLEAARRIDSVRAIVVVTSDKCYENQEWDWAYRETDPMGGFDPYSASKGCTELVTASYRRSFFEQQGCLVASARAGNVIGGGDWAADRLVPDGIRALSAGEPIRIRSPHAIRPWQHVLEPLAGYITLAEGLLKRDASLATAFNFGPNELEAAPVGQVVDTLCRHWGEDASWETDGGDHPHEARFLKVDSSRARNQLGWQPRLSLDEAVEWTVDWHRRWASGGDAYEVTRSQILKYQELRAGNERGTLPILQVA